MANSRGVSLRYKILLMLTLLPLVMLGIYLAVAINIFRSDKLAYVYESSAAVSRTLSTEAMTSLSSILISVKPIMQEYLIRKSFAEISHGIMSVENPVKWIAVYDKDGGVFKPGSVLEKEGVSSQAEIAEIPHLQEALMFADTQNRFISTPFHDDRIVLMEKVVDALGSRIFVIMAVVPDLADAFRSSSNGENYLIDSAGNLVFAPKGNTDSTIIDRTGETYFHHLTSQNFASGAEGFKTPGGEDVLASFARVGFGDMTVVSLVNRADALKGVRVLILRSILFAGVLISFTVIVSLFASGSLTSALFELFSATRAVASGNFAIRVNVRSNDEVGELAGSFNAMAAEVARLLEETAEKARMQSELNTARTVQETLFPPTEAVIGNVKIAGHYEPASECGGDWWYYCEIGQKVYFWIGDATGHGAPAALITSAARSASTIIERLNVEPRDALTLLNRAIYDVSKGQIMMTFFLASYDQQTREFSYANASHEGPYLIHKTDHSVRKKDLIPLNEVNSPRLGQARDTVYEQTTLVLEPGDRIFFYTDGLPDIQNPELKAWGEREFIKAIVTANADYPPVAEAVAKIVSIYSAYRQNAPLKDDVTFFMCQIDG